METTKIEGENHTDAQENEEQQRLIASEEQKKTIFVAVDESDDTFYVLRWVLDNLFKHFLSSTGVDGTELHDHLTLLHVMSRLPQYVFPGAVAMPALPIKDSAIELQKEHAGELLTRAMQICKEKNVEAEIVVREGDPKDTICQATEDLDVDLLVVGSRGRGKIKRALLGSVSDYCAHHAKCPVVIVKPPKE